MNIHKSLYCPTRLTSGVKSATGLFQWAIENRLKGIQTVVVCVDDILIGGRDLKSNLQNLHAVFLVIQDAVVYLGMHIDKEGISTIEDKISAIKEAPNPKSLSELQAFLGILSYYHKHLKDIANALEPLHSLLQKGMKLFWGIEHEETFKTSSNARVQRSTVFMSGYNYSGASKQKKSAVFCIFSY